MLTYHIFCQGIIFDISDSERFSASSVIGIRNWKLIQHDNKNAAHLFNLFLCRALIEHDGQESFQCSRVGGGGGESQQPVKEDEVVCFIRLGRIFFEYWSKCFISSILNVNKIIISKELSSICLFLDTLTVCECYRSSSILEGKCFATVLDDENRAAFVFSLFCSGHTSTFGCGYRYPAIHY